MMRTRAKKKHVASDRAWRENVPRHILFWAVRTGSDLFFRGHYCIKKQKKTYNYFFWKNFEKIKIVVDTDDRLWYYNICSREQKRKNKT